MTLVWKKFKMSIMNPTSLQILTGRNFSFGVWQPHWLSHAPFLTIRPFSLSLFTLFVLNNECFAVRFLILSFPFFFVLIWDCIIYFYFSAKERNSIKRKKIKKWLNSQSKLLFSFFDLIFLYPVVLLR